MLSLRLIAATLLMLAPLCAQQNPSPRTSAEVPTIQVNVKLVNVFTAVADAHGTPISGLRKEDFRLFEDNTEQQISIFERESAVPLSIVMAVDTSLSTRKDLPLEIVSARKFSRAILRPEDSLSVFSFANTVSQMLGFTNDERQVEAALKSLTVGSATALYDAIFLASKALDRRQGRKVIVLITDGGDTASRADYHEALRSAQIAEAMIFAIIMVPIEADAGRDTGGEHALMQLAEDTGGKFYYASSSSTLDEAFSQISDELRTQYLLAYYPSTRRGQEFRRLRVELTPEARAKSSIPLLLRHRAGYYNSKID